MCNHPKQADYAMLQLLPIFVLKKAMFNLNEDNSIVMAQHPSDMRIGINGMCGQVRKVGLDPTNGDVYISVCKSRNIMKLLHWERGGYVMYYKRLEEGRFSDGYLITTSLTFVLHVVDIFNVSRRSKLILHIAYIISWALLTSNQ